MTEKLTKEEIAWVKQTMPRPSNPEEYKRYLELEKRLIKERAEAEENENKGRTLANTPARHPCGYIICRPV